MLTKWHREAFWSMENAVTHCLQHGWSGVNVFSILTTETWDILYKKAGKEMTLFIRKYIYPPMLAMSRFIDSNPQTIQIENHGNEIIISDSKNKYKIIRKH